MQLRVGVMEGVLKQPRAETFAAAARLGFDGVELELEARADPAAVQALALESAVAVSSLICDGRGLGSLDVDERACFRVRLRRAIAAASALGAGVVLLPQFELTDAGDADAVQRFCEDIRASEPRSGVGSVVVGWEGSLDAAGVRQVLERSEVPWLGCYFDFANTAKQGRDPAAELRELGGLVAQVHAKNVNKQPLDAPGVDLRECLRALQEIGYDRWIVLETASGDDPLAMASHNLRVLREALESV